MRHLSSRRCHHGETMSIVKPVFLPAILTLGAAFFFSAPLSAQKAPLRLGSIRNVTQLRSCPEGYLGGMTCYSGKVERCQSDSDLGFTYGYQDPDGELAGTILFHDGGGGTSPALKNGKPAFDGTTYAQKYLTAGFRVIFVEWDSDWENSTNGNLGTSIKDAACRPATLFNYLYENYYVRGGMCGQGFSAGSAAVAYSLAWYGSANYFDNVELLSGPVFSNVEEGCQVPPVPPVTVCPAGEYGCNGTAWPDPPQYVGGDQNLVGSWSGYNTCNQGKITSSRAQSAWKSMSIVDGTDNPSFSYPHTSMAGWLCSNVNTVQNNTAAEGDYFYLQFADPSQTAGLSVTRIDHCDGVEGVTEGVTPQGEVGFDAISAHMIAACVSRH